MLPEDLIWDKIKYFRYSLASHNVEGRVKEIHLIDEDPKAFELLVKWLFEGDTYHCDCRKHFHTQDDILAWCKLHILADKLNLPGLAKNASENIMSCLRRHRAPVAPEVVTYTYSDGEPELQQILVAGNVEYFFTGIIDTTAWVASLTSNTEFHEDITKGITEHITGDEEGCTYGNECKMHASW
jgi:hypothetical protein